jgi:hypothetical protein
MTQADLVRRACAERGIQIINLEGGVLWLHSSRVDIKTIDLRHVQLRELQQFTSEEDAMRYSRGAARK